MNDFSPEIVESIDTLLQIGIALSAEQDHNRLMEMILSEARSITRADAGTLYLCGEDCLHFTIMHNDTLETYQGGNGEPIDLPPVALREENVSTYVAIHGETINIPDVYEHTRFDFAGPRRYDALTGYRTKSMLVVPLKRKNGEILGVLQLINAIDRDGVIVSFPQHIERIVESLGSQAAIAISNQQYIEEIDNLFNSFVEVMAAAIDARSPYNVNHTKSVVRLSEQMALHLNKLHEQGLYPEYFSHDRLKQLIMAAWLHDIGKIATPLTVMDKPDRLGNRYMKLEQRFLLIRALLRVQHLEGELGDVAWNEVLAELDEAWMLIEYCNDPAHFVDDEKRVMLQQLSERVYRDEQGQLHPYLEADELECLSIARGTLTPKERLTMENHVIMTEVMLGKMYFNKKYRDVPIIAPAHHEFLDGTGYPKGISGNEISLEVRIMTIMDIFDALTATDRPYKKPMPVERALTILNNMAEEGKLDEELVKIFVSSSIWGDRTA